MKTEAEIRKHRNDMLQLLRVPVDTPQSVKAIVYALSWVLDEQSEHDNHVEQMANLARWVGIIEDVDHGR